MQPLLAPRLAAARAAAAEAEARAAVLLKHAGALEKALAAQVKARKDAADAFNKAKTPHSDAEHEAFMARLGLLDERCEALQGQLDTLRLDAYFPPERSFVYRFGGGGVYMGLRDFWLERLAATVSVEVVAGRGRVWAPADKRSAPPGLLLKACPDVSVQLRDLGLRGDGIPSSLKHIAALDFEVALELQVSVAFYASASKAAGSAASKKEGPPALPLTAEEAAVGQAPPSPGPDGINELVRGFGWRMLDDFKCEVKRLDYKSRGGGISLPNALVKFLLNQILPGQVRTAFLSALPPELGLLLALNPDHHLSTSFELEATSLPLEVLAAPLEAAPTGPIPAAALPTLSYAAPEAERFEGEAPPPPAPLAGGGEGTPHDDAGGASPRHAGDNGSHATSTALHGAEPVSATTRATLDSIARLVAPAASSGSSGVAAGRPRPVSGAPLPVFPSIAAVPRERLASWSAAVMGLTGWQAQALVAAQAGVPLPPEGAIGGGRSKSLEVPPAVLQALAATPVAAGGHFLRTAGDIAHFVALYNPNARAQVAARRLAAAVARRCAPVLAQAAAPTQPGGSGAPAPATAVAASSGSRLSFKRTASSATVLPAPSSPAGHVPQPQQQLQVPGQVTASSSAPDVSSLASALLADPHPPRGTEVMLEFAGDSDYLSALAAWRRVIEALQRRVDDHNQAQLMAAFEAAASLPDPLRARQLTLAAQQRAVASYFSVAELFLAAEALSAKPLSLRLMVRDFSLRCAAEPVLGMLKAVSLRAIRESQAAALAALGVKRGGVVLAAAGAGAKLGLPASDASVGGGAPSSFAAQQARLRGRTRTDSTTSGLGAPLPPSSRRSSTTSTDIGQAMGLDAFVGGGGDGAVQASSGASVAPSATGGSRWGPGGSSASSAGGPSLAARQAAVLGGGTVTLLAGGVGPSAANLTPTSILANAAQRVEDVNDMVNEAGAVLGLLHSTAARVTTSLGVSLRGGRKGVVTLQLRQLQVECQPGVSLPVGIPEGLYPPSATYMALESSAAPPEFEGADVEGVLAGAGGHGHGHGHHHHHHHHHHSGLAGVEAARPDGLPLRPRSEATGPGSLSILLAWPVAGASAAPAQSGSSKALVSTATSSIDHKRSRGASLAVGTGQGGRISRTDSLASLGGVQLPPGIEAPAAPPGTDLQALLLGLDAPPPPPTLSSSQLEVAAAVRLHRVWMGLRVDETALLAALRASAEAAAATGQPRRPVYALEVNLRPAAAPSSLHPEGLPHAAVARMTAQRREEGAALQGLRGALAGKGSTAKRGSSAGGRLGRSASQDSLSLAGHAGPSGPFPFVAGLETAPWTRLSLEVGVCEVTGDLSVVSHQLSGWLESLTAAAAEEAAGLDEEDDRSDVESGSDAGGSDFGGDGELGYVATGSILEAIEDAEAADEAAEPATPLSTAPEPAHQDKHEALFNPFAAPALAATPLAVALVVAAPEPALTSPLTPVASAPAVEAPAPPAVPARRPSAAAESVVVTPSKATPEKAPGLGRSPATSDATSNSGPAAAGAAASDGKGGGGSVALAPVAAPPTHAHRRRGSAAAALAAHLAPSADAMAARIRKYLQAEDLRLLVSMSANVVALDAPPAVPLSPPGATAAGVGTGSSNGGGLHPLLLDVTGVLEPPKGAALLSFPSRPVLSIAVSSKSRQLAPSLVPAPGSMLAGKEAGQAGGGAAGEGEGEVTAVAAAAPAIAAAAPSTTPQKAAGVTAPAPPPPPAAVLEIHVALLGLLEDVAALLAAFSSLV